MRTYGLIIVTLLAQTAWAIDTSQWSDKTLCRVVKEQSTNQAFVDAVAQRGLTCAAANSTKKVKRHGVKNGLCEAPYKTPLVLAKDYDVSFNLKARFTSKNVYQLSDYRFAGFGTDPKNHMTGGGVAPEIKVVADLNNDGRDDIWLDYYESDVPSLVLYGTAEGGFVAETNMQGDIARRHIRNGEVADINNDGWLDLMGFTTGDPGNRLEAEGYNLKGRHVPRGQQDLLLMNLQGGGFAEMEIPEIRRNDWNHGGSAGDINGDGWIEILPLSEGEKHHTVPLVNHEGKKHTLSRHSYSSEISRMLTSDVDAGDLNGDGIDDMVFNMMPIDGASNRKLSRLGSIRVIYGDKDMNFKDNLQLKFGESWVSDAQFAELTENYSHETPMKMPDGWVMHTVVGPTNIEIMDINGDDRPDILQAFFIAGTGLWQTSGFKAYINMGDCFADGTDYHFPAQQTNRALHTQMYHHTNYVHNFRSGDVNNDGLKDIVLQVDGNSDWVDSGALRFPYLFINNGQNVYLPPATANMAGIVRRNDDIVPGDFNGDGLTDLVSLYGDHRQTPVVRLHLQKTNPDPEDTLHAPDEFELVAHGVVGRMARLMKHTMKLDLSIDDVLTAKSGAASLPRNTTKKNFYGRYLLEWYIINIGPSGGFEKGAEDILVIDENGPAFDYVDKWRSPSPNLRKKLKIKLSDAGDITFSGPLGLFGNAGPAFPTTVFGRMKQRFALGIWEQGDPILVKITKQ